MRRRGRETERETERERERAVRAERALPACIRAIICKLLRAGTRV
jgi:hypothetical protein